MFFEALKWLDNPWGLSMSLWCVKERSRKNKTAPTPPTTINTDKNNFYFSQKNINNERRWGNTEFSKVWQKVCEDLGGHARPHKEYLQAFFIVVCLCVSDRRDQVQLCLVFISDTQSELGDKGGTETRAGSRGKQKQASTCLCFPPSGDEMLPSSTELYPTCSCRNLLSIHSRKLAFKTFLVFFLLLFNSVWL